MGWFSSIGGFFSHAAQSVAGEVSHIGQSVAGETNTIGQGLGHIYAYGVRPAIPAIATVASAFIPGGQIATPYLLAYDTGAYGHALATQGLGGFENVNSRGNIEAGLVTTATYGAGQALGFTGTATTYNASSGMSSTDLLSNLGNSSFNPLAQTPFQVLESAGSSVYNGLGAIGGKALSGLSALTSLKSAFMGAGSNSTMITNSTSPSGDLNGLGFTPGAAATAAQQGQTTSSSGSGIGAGGAYGANSNNDLAWTLAVALGVAAISS